MNIPMFTDENTTVLIKKANKHKSVSEHLAQDYQTILTKPQSVGIIIRESVSKFRQYDVSIYTKEMSRPVVVKIYRVKANTITNFPEGKTAVALKDKEALAFITHLQAFLL